MRKAELVVKTGKDAKTYEMRENHPLFVGRSVECDLYLPSPGVSRRHAVFLLRNGTCGIKDLESSNGTYLNGERIVRPMRLKSGDAVQIADIVIEFLFPPIEAYGDPDQTAILLVPVRDKVFVEETLSAQPQPQAEPAPADIEDAMYPDALPDAPLPSPRKIRSSTTSVLREQQEPPASPVQSADAAEPPILALNPEQEKKASASIRKIPKPPPAPRSGVKFDDEEVGDGSGDDQFAGEPDAPEEEDHELALSKAAAEAGLVGEFVPDVPEPSGGEQENSRGKDAPPLSPGGSGVTGFSLTAESVVPHERAANAIPIDDAFREAIEARLFLYSFLSDMKREREALLAANPSAPDAVKSELARQDREMDKLLTAEQAESMIEKRLARREDLKQKIKEAKENGLPSPPKPSREMLEAEDIAINQWTIIAQSYREALPAVFAEGFRVGGREPLAGVLEEAGIDGNTLLGGGSYLLALEDLLEETKYNRAFVKAKLSNMTPPETKKAGSGKRFLGFLSRPKEEEEADEQAEEGESYDELAETEKQLGLRAAWIAQEQSYIEAFLIKEFWRVYVEIAVACLPKHEEMTLAARAFLRYGVIGFMPWWMNDDIRNHIMEDCSREVEHHMTISKNATNILYADEYLAAVLNMECTPAMDENLEINERNSPNWKADKALRKLINARSQTKLMQELIGVLEERIARQEDFAAKVEERIANLLPGSKNFKQAKSELSQQRQSHKVEITKLTNLINKIRTQTLATLEEIAAETDERFNSGELPRPTPEFLIRRECEAVRKIGRLLANLKERFLPLVVRDNFQLGLDTVNDRLAIAGEVLDIERRDPAIFLENIIPSKKKAARVDLRISPVVVLVPSAGILAFSWNPRQKPEDGRLAIPTCFIRPRLRERQLIYLMSDFRWDTAKAAAGMDVMNSDTIVAAFMSVRWDWRKRSKEGREKGLIYSEQNDRTNWRRVYEAYMQTAMDGGKKLFNRNYDFYERIIGKYFDMPDEVQLLRK